MGDDVEEQIGFKDVPGLEEEDEIAPAPAAQRLRRLRTFAPLPSDPPIDKGEDDVSAADDRCGPSAKCLGAQ
jgi:hypothetical protein